MKRFYSCYSLTLFALSLNHVESRTNCGKNEYYLKELGINYQGTSYHSASGKFCQNWSSNYPNNIADKNIFQNDEERPDHNHCRNENGREGGPWCYLAEAEHNSHVSLSKYTNFKSVKNIPEFIAPQKDFHPAMSSDGRVYLPRSEAFKVMSVSQMAQYDKDQEGKDWEYCNHLQRNYGKCYPCPAGQINDGNDICIDDPEASTSVQPNSCPDGYHIKERTTTTELVYVDGKTKRQTSGKSCQNWNQDSPNKVRDHFFPNGKPNDNVCRNPGNHPKGPWCYFSDTNSLRIRVYNNQKQKMITQRMNYYYCFKDWKTEMCEKNFCTCENGKPAQGGLSQGNISTCTQHNDEICESCHEGYELDILSMSCVLIENTAGCDAAVDEYLLEPLGVNYQGQRDVTNLGRNCLWWNEVANDNDSETDIEDWVPFKLESKPWQTNWVEWTHNFCRNPDNDPNGPWCYVQDDEEIDDPTGPVILKDETVVHNSFMKQTCGQDTKKYGSCYVCPGMDKIAPQRSMAGQKDVGSDGKCPESVGKNMKNNGGDNYNSLPYYNPDPWVESNDYYEDEDDF